MGPGNVVELQNLIELRSPNASTSNLSDDNRVPLRGNQKVN